MLATLTCIKRALKKLAIINWGRGISILIGHWFSKGWKVNAPLPSGSSEIYTGTLEVKGHGGGILLAFSGRRQEFQPPCNIWGSHLQCRLSPDPKWQHKLLPTVTCSCAWMATLQTRASICLLHYNLCDARAMHLSSEAFRKTNLLHFPPY